MNCNELTGLLDQWLQPHRFDYYGPNGLQVENSGQPIQKIALAVSATLEVITEAKNQQAQALLVHHGLFWDGGQAAPLRGTQYQKIKALIQQDIALIAYHLPLDFHPQWGNNIQLGQALGLTEIQGILPQQDYHQGVMGRAPGWSFTELSNKLTDLLGRSPLGLNLGPGQIEQIAIVTGGGQKYFRQALSFGAQAFITGEASEFIYGQAQEEKAHFFAAGHYATERFGILALGKKLQAEQGLACFFIPTQNPI